VQSAGHGNDSSGTNSEDVAKHAMVMVAGGPLPGLRSYWPSIHRGFKELQFFKKNAILKSGESELKAGRVWLKARTEGQEGKDEKAGRRFPSIKENGMRALSPIQSPGY
jgi:hypothetical protein